MGMLEVYIPRRVDDGRLVGNLGRGVEYFGVGSSVLRGREMLYRLGMKTDVGYYEGVLGDDDVLSLGYRHWGCFGLEGRNEVAFKSGRDGLVMLLRDVLIDVTLQNTIVRTVLTGMRGTVKEYVSADDYRIVVSGGLVDGMRGRFPLDDMCQFVDVLEDEGEIAVGSVFLNKLGIDRVVMEGYRFPQSENRFVNEQRFSVNFLSDRGVELDII